MKMQTNIVFLLAAVSVSAIMLGTPTAFAQVTIEPAVGSGAPGCEETADGCYIPSTATVDVGGVVIMTNTDSAAHTFTSGTPDGGPDGIFDTSLLMVDGSYEWSPDTVGEVPYFCMVHPWMQGLIVVQEAGAQPATSAPYSLDDIIAEIQTSDGVANEVMTIDLTLTDLDGNGVEHITYNIKALQDSQIVLDEEGHMHKGTLTNSHTTTPLSMDASDSMPVNITIESVGFGHDELYVTSPGEITTKQVVPEFGTIAVLIMVVAITSVIVVSAKSRLSLMPKL
ncbi:PEFG-CTERM sorting domain-containing protein [Nitrosopumilus sp. b3]|uniref:PEFG-CTERM sorting domain-containing protein n=1 Tax=Nitrosopumilus sp. b3 TaxID=2109909 RepID=UPI0031843716